LKNKNITYTDSQDYNVYDFDVNILFLFHICKYGKVFNAFYG